MIKDKKTLLTRLEKLKEYKEEKTLLVQQVIDRINKSSNYQDSEKYLENKTAPQVLIIDSIHSDLSDLEEITEERVNHIIIKNISIWEPEVTTEQDLIQVFTNQVKKTLTLSI